MEKLTSDPSPLCSPASRHEHRRPPAAREDTGRRLLSYVSRKPNNGMEPQDQLHLQRISGCERRRIQQEGA
jgi:hypothetical protein